MGNGKKHPFMATPNEFQLACPGCDGPGLYMIQDGHRVRTGMTSNLSRFVRRQRAARVLYVARLEPGETTRAWRSLLSSLQGLTPKECQYEVGAARDVARGMLGAVRRGNVLTAKEIQRRAQRAQDGSESVASTRLESPDSGPSQELPPFFRQLLREIGD